MPSSKPKQMGSPDDSIKLLFSTSDTWSLNLAPGLEIYVDGKAFTPKNPVLVKATNGYIVPIDGTNITNNKIVGYFSRYHNIKTDGTVSSPEYGSGSGLLKASRKPAKKK